MTPRRLPGIGNGTGPTNFAPIRQAPLARFDGERPALFGEVPVGR